MRKLLSAEFVRLFKSWIFWLCLIFYTGVGIYLVMMRWLDIREHPDLYAEFDIIYRNADDFIFSGGMFFIFVVAVFIGIFVGTEYSDGTIRNKLAIGHTRSNIYLSKLIVCATADIIMYVLYILAVLAFGYLLTDGTTIKARDILIFTMTGIAVILALTALLLLLSMSIQSKAVGSVVTLTTVIVMFFASMMVFEMLSAPEYFDAYMYMDETGEIVSEEKEKNPFYLTGTKREIYEFLNDFLPVLQLYQINSNTTDNLDIIVIYDCILLVVTTGTGIVIFRKKNLK